MGAARANPRAVAFRGERIAAMDGPQIRNTTTGAVRVRFIPGERLEAGRSVATRPGDRFQFSDRAYVIAEDGSLRKVRPGSSGAS